jgi:hypothetical protein
LVVKRNGIGRAVEFKGGALMQAVDVLRDQRGKFPTPFQSGQRFVAGIR